MQLHISGHHIEITDGLRAAIAEKYHKIESHYPQLDRIDIILKVERNQQMVETNTQYQGTAVAVHASDADLYVAIADCARKLDAALAHRKGQTISKRGQNNVETSDE